MFSHRNIVEENFQVYDVANKGHLQVGILQIVKLILYGTRKY